MRFATRPLHGLAILVFACAGVHAGDMAQTLFPVVRDGAWGYIDASGKLAIAPRFERAGAFHDGIAQVRAHGGTVFIDTSGKAIALPSFDRIDDFSEGLAAVNTGEKRVGSLRLLLSPGRWGYIDHAGKLAIAQRYTAADAFSDGLAAVRWKDGSGFIDRNGKVVIRAEFDTTAHFSGGVAMLSLHGHRRYIDRTGRVLPTPTLDDDAGGDLHEGRAAVSIGGQWGYIDATGKLAIPARYIDAKEFSEGLAAVQVPVDRATETPCQQERSRWTSGRKFGYIDRLGTLVVPARFDGAGPFVDGLAAVRTCNTVAYIDATGKVMLPTTYGEAFAFHGGLAEVWAGGSGEPLRGYIDATGREVWAPSK